MRLPRLVIVATILVVFVSCKDDGASGKSPQTGVKPANTTASTKQPAAATATKKPTAKDADANKKSAKAPAKPIEVYKPGGFHVDDTRVDYYRPERRTPKRRAQRRIYLNLMSSPAGAVALIDGVRVGTTPTYWEGSATGKPRDFTFVLAGYVTQRYRFVAVTSGTVHAPLKKVIKQSADAGVAKQTASN